MTFTPSPNSIEGTLPQQDSDIQYRYRRNKIKYEGDYRAMEAWASSGFGPAQQLEDVDD
jgi:hypothetical protein